MAMSKNPTNAITPPITAKVFVRLVIGSPRSHIRPRGPLSWIARKTLTTRTLAGKTHGGFLGHDWRGRRLRISFDSPCLLPRGGGHGNRTDLAGTEEVEQGSR